MSQDVQGCRPSLFKEDSAPSPASGGQGPHAGPLPPPRLRRANRSQLLLRPRSLEQVLADDHDARVVWAVVGRGGLSRFLDSLRARGGAPRRAAPAPEIPIS